MRPSFVTLFVLFFSLAASVATNPQLLSRHDRKRSLSVISSRQYHVPRSLVDLCINTDVHLFAGVGPLLASILGPLDLISKVHLCLCLKDLDIYLATNSEVQSLVHLLGPNVIGSRIRAIINASPHARKCTLPQHAHHTCNTEDPCHWACDENYVRDGDRCTCAPPFVSCNGICSLFHKGCSSAVSRSLNIRSQSILTLSQAKASCKLHETVCGIPGREDLLAFECIDTTIAKDSCGGCMAPHPFREVNTVHEVFGQDCTRIPNARSVGCSHSRCIVTSCQEGWIPDVNNTGCMVDLTQTPGRVSRRSDPLSIHVAAGTVVDSEIISRLVAIVDAVLHLGLPSSASDANATTTISFVVSLLNDVNDAAADLVTSPTVRAFLQNIDHFLDISSLLKSWLSSCACVDRLGLFELVGELNSLIAAATELRTLCLNRPVLSGPESHHTVTVLPPSATTLPDQPLVIRPSDLLAGLGLNGGVGVTMHGLHGTSNLLGVLGLGPEGHQPSTPNIDSDLSGKIVALVHLVIILQDHLAAPPLNGPSTLVDMNILVSIGQVTKDLLEARTVAGVVTSLEHLVTLANAGVHVLENCDYIGLQPLSSNLKHILGAAREALTWCQSNPVVPGLTTLPAPNTTDGNVPVVVGLSDLLNRLSLATVKPGVRNLIKSDFLGCLELLVDLTVKLRVSVSLTLSTSCVGSAELALVKEMADALTSLTPSTTTPAILISANRIIVAEASLEKALQTCSDAETVKDLLELLIKITKVTLQLGDLCGSSETTSVHYSITSFPPATSRSARIVTSTRRLLSATHLPSTKLTSNSENSSITCSPTETISSPTVSTRPASPQTKTTLDLQVDADVLIDLFITLADECGTRNCTSVGTSHRDFLDTSLQQVIAVFTATSWSKFIGGLDDLTSASVDALNLLDDCACVAERKLEEVYKKMVKIVDGSLALQRFCREMDMNGTKVGSVNGQPIVAGLTRLLNGLGIEGNAVI